MTEISRVARALKEITKCDKLNIAALGNVVPQLHVHIIARRTSDAAWPRPVWGVMQPLAHDAEEVQTLHQRASPQNLAWVRTEHDDAFDSFPLGRPAFVTQSSTAPRICAPTTKNCSRWRAQRDARAYVVLSRLAGGEEGERAVRARC